MLKYYIVDVVIMWLIIILVIVLLVFTCVGVVLTVINIGIIDRTFIIGVTSRSNEIVFSVFVTTIRILVLIYSMYYIIDDHYIPRFVFMVLLFYASIIILVNSSTLIMLFVGWDGLGVSSYWLVVYYINSKSNNAGIVTILSNRVGDFLIMFVIIVLMLSTIRVGIRTIVRLWLAILMVISLTKSAQWPFSSWLPLAMAAPTPVSALVHSRTLVTAGIVLLYRYYDIIQPSIWFAVVFTIRIVTITYSRVIGTVELDFKKIVALSTLSQVSLIIVSLSLNVKILRFFHLCTHAFFKSLLFLVCGIIIHQIWSQQYINTYTLRSDFAIPYLLYSLSGLCGVAFFAGYYSKDAILERIEVSVTSIFLIMSIFLVIVLTTVYSLRIFFRSTTVRVITTNRLRVYMISFISVMLLSLISALIGLSIVWNMNQCVILVVRLESKLYTLLMFVYGILVYLVFKSFYNSTILSTLVRIVLLNKITVIINSVVHKLKIMIVKMFEKGWLPGITLLSYDSIAHATSAISMLMNKSKLSVFMFFIVITLVVGLL